ncbi:3-keto-5-aminohexanoate cleavage protein [Sphingosinicella sp. LHD-64]|uniref:3-keto-5-aminohexanoate cleavage protein n=1 Tax=Sphingosinicella sp. LHD-64 TaxID=3072139 RepID=UPI00280E083F|nr:3-keto-5-aminohexanoate cleavage protein [Sphingosinicella sp. LHD-64]MDQ8757432.1 3-keto-5-aminohexanoate cleavage protein [Sphingosinicella sp. LHD-64]
MSVNIEPLPLWEAARREMETYHFVAGADSQPKWDIPQTIAINVAVSGRFDEGQSGAGHPTSIEDYVDAASEVIEAGACGIHVDFTWVIDNKGRRLDLDLPPVEAYGQVLEPLRKRFGYSFVSNLNVLNGKTFEECMSPARAGLCEVAPCAPGHPEAFVLPAMQAMTDCGVKPELAVHSTGEIDLAKRRLLDTGVLKDKPYWLILYGLPFGTGRSLISGTAVNDTQQMALHLFMMVDQIRKIDPTAAITVCAAGRATMYMTTLATMMGLHIRVGVEDTPWKYPNSDARLASNLEMFNMAKDIAALHGRRPATADEYRGLIGLESRGA